MMTSRFISAVSYTHLWRKTVERNRERLMKKIHVLLGQIDDVIAQEKSSENNEEVEFTPAMPVSYTHLSYH